MIYRGLFVVLLAGVLWLPASVFAQETPSTDTTGLTIHVVQRGENLYRIAQSYGLTTDQLTQMNGLTDPDNLEVGQRLLVPATNGAAAVQPVVHVVQPGESLQSIADLYGVDPLELANLNGVTAENPLYVGQSLTIIPAASFVPPTEQPPAEISITSSGDVVGPQGILHTVLDGETLYQIATRYGATVADVAAANGISDPTIIYAGQQLIIPGVQPPQLALDLPDPVQSLTVDPLILVEGETGRFRLTTSKAVSVSGTFLDRDLNVVAEQDNTLHTALVGIPIFTAPGVYPLKFTLTDTSGQQTPLLTNIQIVAGQYGSEYITLLSDRAELLDPNVEGTEQTLVGSIMSGFTSTRYFDGPMGLPAAAMMTSPFGTRRAYDGGPFDHYHMGADFAGGPGTPVMAAAAGVVVMADALNVRGNATIIDHGWGVYTGYWHQTEQYVHPGDVVTAGQVIGTIGSTGRVTGPHLHWEVWVGGVPVDPMQWVRESFS